MATPDNSSTNFSWRGEDTGDTLADRLLGTSQDDGNSITASLKSMQEMFSSTLEKVLNRLDALDGGNSSGTSGGSSAQEDFQDLDQQWIALSRGPTEPFKTFKARVDHLRAHFCALFPSAINEERYKIKLEKSFRGDELIMWETWKPIQGTWESKIQSISEGSRSLTNNAQSSSLAKMHRSSFLGHLPVETVPGARFYADCRGPFETESIYDNGEFSSAAVEELVRSHGGTPITSAAYCPELQGVIERVWRTIHEMAATMLGASKLHETFWEHAILYAVQLYNDLPPTRVPSTGVYASPNEKYTGVRPDLTKYQPFGARAYVYIPVKRKNFKARAEQGIFVGRDKSSYPGYIIYRPVKRTTHYDDEDNLLYQTTSVVVERFSSGDSFIVGYRKLLLPNGTLNEDTMKNSCPGDYSNQPLGLHKKNQIGVDCEKITGLKRGGFEDERSVLPKKSKSTASSTSDPTGKCTGSRCPGSSDQTSKEEDVQEQSNMRMRERRRRFPSAYGDSLASYLLAFQSGPQQPDPDSHAAAMRAYDAQGWKDAEQQEIDSLTRLQVLSKPLRLPDGARVVKTKWVYKRKRNADGTVERLRARLVAKGFSQVFGEDYFDTYAPVARLTTLRLVYAMTVVMDLSLAGMDVDAAFLNADLQEDLYIKAPVGTKPLPQKHVYKLLKALYGLKQSPKEWNHLYTTDLLKKYQAINSDDGKLMVNKADTPMDHRIKLSKDGASRSRYKSDSKTQGESGNKCEDSELLPPEYNYRALVAKYSASPRMAHWKACKRILRYLAGTIDFGIHYTKKSTTDSVQMDGLPTGAPISWQSRAQVSTALSTMEAEYMAASAAAQEALWLRMILEELGVSLD
eukprot:gene29244-36261_t